MIALPLALAIGIAHTLITDYFAERAARDERNLRMVAARYRRITRYNRAA